MPLEQSKPFTRFDFDLTAAIRLQLLATFDALPIVPLMTEMLSQIETGQGVYQIYLSGKLMYVGKDVDSLPKRLGEHLRKLPGDKNVNVADVGFKCVIIDRNWIAYVDLTSLAALYQRQGLCEWNKSGS